MIAGLCRVPPLTPLGKLLARTGAEDPDRVADTLLALMKRPGWEGVRVAMNTAHLLGSKKAQAALVEVAYGRRIDREGFALILAMAWRGSSWTVVDVAGSRERLLAWFWYADFSGRACPLTRDRINPAGLPESFTIYRGGAGPAEELAAGLCWTLRREMAGHYARKSLARSPDAPPVILRREAGRGEALAYFGAWVDQELIMSAPGPWTIDTADQAEIVGLADSTVADFEREQLESDDRNEEWALQGWAG